jgi:hypothetical protein
MCEVNLLEVEIVSGLSKNQHGIRVGTLKSGIEDFDTRICRDCRGFAWKKEGKSTVGQLDEATRLRFEDRLDEDTNFSPWKEWIALLLEENEIWDIVEKTQVVPTDTTLLATYKKKNVKSKRMLLDVMKDYIIPRV